MKKYFLMLLVLINIVMISTNAFASSDTPQEHKSGDFIYTILKDDTAEIIKYLGTDKNVINCTSMPSIFIPSSVELIGEKAFHNCYNLTVFVEKYSYANQYCIDNALSFVDMLEY